MANVTQIISMITTVIAFLMITEGDHFLFLHIVMLLNIDL